MLMTEAERDCAHFARSDSVPAASGARIPEEVAVRITARLRGL